MTLKGYSMLHKKKVSMYKVIIIKNKHRYLAMGKDSDGNPINLFMSEEDAKKAVKEGLAKKGMGFK